MGVDAESGSVRTKDKKSCFASSFSAAEVEVFRSALVQLVTSVGTMERVKDWEEAP